MVPQSWLFRGEAYLRSYVFAALAQIVANAFPIQEIQWDNITNTDQLTIRDLGLPWKDLFKLCEAYLTEGLGWNNDNLQPRCPLFKLILEKEQQEKQADLFSNRAEDASNTTLPSRELRTTTIIEKKVITIMTLSFWLVCRNIPWGEAL